MTQISDCIYRYFSLPENILSSLEVDNIKYHRNLTIDNILKEKEKNWPDQKSLPEPYFSLYKINYLIYKKMLYLRQLEDFNDPFEEFIWLKDDIDNATERVKNSGVRSKSKKIKRRLNKSFPNGMYTSVPYMKDKFYGLICFCRSYEDPRMWGHYSNGARGVCVEFEMHPQLQGDLNSGYCTGAYNKGENNTRRTYFFGNISYSPKPYNLDLKLMESLKKKSKSNPSFTELDEYIVGNLLSKSVVWEYEEEVRLVMLGQSRPILLDQLISYEDHKPFLRIKKIIFGCKMEKEVKNIIKNSIFPDISGIQFAEIEPLEGEYMFKLKDL